MIKYLFRCSFVFAGIVLLASCGNGAAEKNDKVKKVSPEAKKPSGQFPFYKDIAIRPGINFEVVSWGKGVDTVGGYLILMTDTLKDSYKSLSNERKGIMIDAWNMDLDNDGNPEIYIELLSKTNVHDLNVYEYSGGSFNKISFPPLSSTMKKSYGGNDKFIIKNGDLFRSFPIVDDKDSTAKSGGVKMLQYKLSGNSFSVKELTE